MRFEELEVYNLAVGMGDRNGILSYHLSNQGQTPWIPASAGMTNKSITRHSSESWNPAPFGRKQTPDLMRRYILS